MDTIEQATPTHSPSWLLYVVETKRDNYYYVGISSQIERRLKRHNKGRGHWFTKTYGVKNIDVVDGFATRDEAERQEKRITRDLQRKGINAYCGRDRQIQKRIRIGQARRKQQGNRGTP